MREKKSELQVYIGIASEKPEFQITNLELREKVKIVSYKLGIGGKKDRISSYKLGIARKKSEWMWVYIEIAREKSELQAINLELWEKVYVRIARIMSEFWDKKFKWPFY